jgi:cation transport protein ChaC
MHQVLWSVRRLTARVARGWGELRHLRVWEAVWVFFLSLPTALSLRAPQRADAPRWNEKLGVWEGERAASGTFEPPDPLWIFGYGSLCWRADFPFEESFVGSVSGWGRRFAQRSTDHRGTPEQPGLVATLLPDSTLAALGAREEFSPPSVTCGVCYRVSSDERKRVLANLDFREKGGYTREIIDVQRRDGPPVSALLYSATADNPGFSVALLADERAAARVIGTACGPSGPNLEYLLKLASWLDDVGERDPHIEALVTALPPQAEP